MFRPPQQTPMRNDFLSQMKTPKPPDRPLVPYMRYSRKMWPKVRAENPDAQVWDISKIISQMWKEVSDSEKSVFQNEFELEKVEYEKAMKAYQNSNAYMMAQKNRQKGNEKMSRSRMDVGGVVIQPVDEDEHLNELNARRLAAVRFDRNHRLISELFNPSVVADTRTVVAQSRIELLKKQANSLTTHQNKLEEELKRLDENFNEKKRLIEEASDEFAEKLKKVCEEKPNVDEQKYEEMVEEWKDKLAEAYQEYKKKQEQMEAKLAAEREKIAEKTPVLYGLTMDSPTDKTEKESEEVKENEAESTET